MAVKVAGVCPGSVAEKKRIKPGDSLVSINGNAVTDVLDYRFYMNDERLLLEIEHAGGRHRRVKIKKAEDDDIGLLFDTYLMDKQRCCKNKCVFCFIDQLPEGLRESLYFKDDDSRLSFFFGNYITLTNLSQPEVDRIIKMHISPVNVSVHTMNPQLRVQMMKNPNAASSLGYLKQFADAGIKLNTQLVLCPGINDGDELEFSLAELSKLYPAVQSIAAVPVGLTCHREGLYPLKGYEPEQAAAVIDTVDAFNRELKKEGRPAIAYAADEFFIRAGREMPGEDYYADYPQLENGVGLWSLLKAEFLTALEEENGEGIEEGRRVDCVTGAAAFPLISELAELACKKFPAKKLEINVIKAENRLFGSSVTVAGLLCGGDIAAAVEGRLSSKKLLLPGVSLKRDEDIFLDDMTLEELQKRLGVKAVPVENNGGRLLEEMLFD